MEPSMDQDISVSPLVKPVKTDQELFQDGDKMSFPVEDLTPALTESSSIPSKIDSSLTPEKSELSSKDVVPHLEKEPDFSSSISNTDTKPSIDTNSISAVKDFLDEAKSGSHEHFDSAKESELFGFNKPLPPEPSDSTPQFLKSETIPDNKTTEEKDDDGHEFVGATGDVSPIAISREDSPIPPPVPKHQNLRDESPDRFESSPEPDFKPMEPIKNEDDIIKTFTAIPSKKEEAKESSIKEEKPKVVDIGVKDIIVEIDAWFNPARLHPQVESLVYWRDPKKSGAVFGVLMVTLLSLTCFSLISVVAYLGLLTLAGTISFRIYKNIMQAVQKTSDGHPFKEYLEMDISLPEEKVAETSRLAAQQLNAAICALRSLFLVEDLVDSIKGLVLLWTLTYVGAIFNGLTLLIIGVILIFSLPRLYEKNKAQVDAYVQIGMDKLSIFTNRMKAALPSAKKDEKPKDQ